MAHGEPAVAGGRRTTGTWKSGTYWRNATMARQWHACWCAIEAGMNGGWKRSMTRALVPNDHSPGTPVCHPNDATRPRAQEYPAARKTNESEYIELHAASAFSFLDGASEPETLVERAVELDMPAIALADRNGVYGAARIHTAAKRNGVKAHIGAEIAVSSFGNRLTPHAWQPHQCLAEPASIVLLCASQTGYQNLCQLITRFKMRESTKTEGAATLD